MQPENKRKMRGNIPILNAMAPTETGNLCKCMKSDAEVIGGCLTTSEMPLVCGGLCNMPLLEMALKYGALI